MASPRTVPCITLPLIQALAFVTNLPTNFGFISVQKMTIFDLAGFPFPLKHPDFSSDAELIKKVGVLGTYVEILREYRDAYEIVEKLREAELEDKMSNFGMLSIRIPDILLSYSILQYAKPFVESKGSTNLIGKEKSISEDKEFLKFHIFVMKLRHKFYAHRELNINRHQLHVLQNFPEKNKIDLITDGQSKVMLMYRTIELVQFSRNICIVADHLTNQINGLKKAVLSNLTGKQREYLIDTDIDVLRTAHIDDGNMGMTIPFQSRAEKESENET